MAWVTNIYVSYFLLSRYTYLFTLNVQVWVWQYDELSSVWQECMAVYVCKHYTQDALASNTVPR